MDVHKPDWTLFCEIRDKAVIYTDTTAPGPRRSACRNRRKRHAAAGPGGIDSPVAGYLMAKRGLKLDAVYFHTHPFTPPESQEKVEKLASLLSLHTCGLTLISVPFTDVIVRIKEKAREEELTLLLRAAMMKTAEKIGRNRGCKALVTGEALSQVASQTVESLSFTDSIPGLPVFRPLIGYDKEEIIAIAKRLDTFDVSILPYADCCTLFAPKRPLVKPQKEKITASFLQLELDELITVAANSAAKKTFGR